MTGILFIKTSSLGDVVHQMPAVTDAARHQPGRRIAWVVEEAFAPLARLHPADVRRELFDQMRPPSDEAVAGPGLSERDTG